MYRILSLTFLLIALSSILTFAQKTPPSRDWFERDATLDHIIGVSTEKAYDSLLTGKPYRTVLVAVIDSGIDINHEDLKSVIWTNEKEIEGNGIDDDHNGYTDDIHGWNFIGGAGGNVNEDTYEITREYTRLRDKFASLGTNKPEKKDKKEYAEYLDVKNKFEKRKAKEAEQYDEAKQQYRLYHNIGKNVQMSIDTLKRVLQISKLTVVDVQKFESNDPTLLFSKGLLTQMLKRTETNDIDSMQMELTSSIEYFQSMIDYYSVIVDYGYNEDYDSRTIVGDDYKNLTEKYYGNNDVTGSDAEHGTHVAGIIAADRTNDLGVKGIADHVKIMPVRVVPNGDERDKDVANGIRYAVDNGAMIISMSFGKSYSPQKKIVDEAVQYGVKKGVLFVHAAGNDSQDIDKLVDYPSRYFIDGSQAKNWLEVGASTWHADEDLPAGFSNYGKKSVDLFAPGQEIYSTTPNNEYKSLSGTSMACPVVSGAAAVLLSYFPDLTPEQVVDILKKSTRKFDGLKVRKPGGGRTDFNGLSNTGGLLNMYDAVKMAMTIRAQKPEVR